METCASKKVLPPSFHLQNEIDSESSPNYMVILYCGSFWHNDYWKDVEC